MVGGAPESTGNKMNKKLVEKAGWGCFSEERFYEYSPVKVDELIGLMDSGIVPRGAGRSYNLSSVSVLGPSLSSSYFKGIEAFSAEDKLLVVGGGTTIEELLNFLRPLNLFLSVLPGSKYVSLGGCIANNVHGKNSHHVACFEEVVEWIDLIIPSGKMKRCSRIENSDLFKWTLGGLGLTGFIVRVCLRLNDCFIHRVTQQTSCFDNLSQTCSAIEFLFEKSFGVAWVDLLPNNEGYGRSVFKMSDPIVEGGLVDSRKAKSHNNYKLPRIATWLGCHLLNERMLTSFNTRTFSQGHRSVGEKQIMLADNHFFPLDRFTNWDRLFGSNGIEQIQLAIPRAHCSDGLYEVFQFVRNLRIRPYLSVVKPLGTSRSHFGFPIDGVTLAMDFKGNCLTDEDRESLQRIVIDLGGRYYLAKNRCLSAEHLDQTDRRVTGFRNFLKSNQMDVIQSQFTRQIGLCD